MGCVAMICDVFRACSSSDLWRWLPMRTLKVILEGPCMPDAS